MNRTSTSMHSLKEKMTLVVFAITLFLVVAIFLSSVSQAEDEKKELFVKVIVQDEICGSAFDIKNTILVPYQARSIQEAVNKIEKKGTIIVFPRTYVENIIIPEGKTIVLRGSPKTTLRARDETKPTILIDGGATVCLNNFTLRGGSYGILAGRIQFDTKPHLLKPAGGIFLQNVKVSQAENGFLLFADRIRVDRSESTRNNGWGGEILGNLVQVTNSEFSYNPSGGLWLGVVLPFCGFTSEIVVTTTSTLDGVDASFNEGPGIYICGANVEIIDSTMVYNVSQGVYATESEETHITGSWIGATTATPEGLWGDGISLINSTGIIDGGSVITLNERAGIYFNDSEGSVSEATITLNKFGIALEGCSDPAIDESSIIFYGNEVYDVGVGLGLCPPPPVED